MTDKPPIALTIAGSDSGGGAGIQADLKAISANRVYGASVVTAVTAQNTCSVLSVHPVPAALVADQIKAVLDDLDVRAIKIGMLFSPAIIEAVAKAIAGFRGSVVIDPVMIAKSGDRLLQAEAIAALRTHLLPHADVLTPNLPEAAILLGEPEAGSIPEMEAQGVALLRAGPKAVLVKGGHGVASICTDLLIRRGSRSRRFEAPRVDTRNTHGTGCTLSAALTAGLARGDDLEQAVRRAHEYLQDALRAADLLDVGSGHGPVHHFHALWA